jgi:hypothetical protein
VASGRSSAEGTSCCDHWKNRYKIAEGFKLSRILLEIQIYVRYFNVPIDSLVTSWAGRWILLRNGFWMRALRPSCRRSGVGSFRLVDAPDGGYVIEGSCCPDPGELCDKEMQECAIGQMLLAEKSGDWKPFFAFIWWRFVRCLTSFVRLLLKSEEIGRESRSTVLV